MFLVGFNGYSNCNSNSKFRSFLVRILVRKDNTDIKVFKRELYTKEIRKKGIEKIRVLQILVQFVGNLSESVSGKQSSLYLSIFLFFFGFIEKF